MNPSRIFEYQGGAELERKMLEVARRIESATGDISSREEAFVLIMWLNAGFIYLGPEDERAPVGLTIGYREAAAIVAALADPMKLNPDDMYAEFSSSNVVGPEFERAGIRLRQKLEKGGFRITLPPDA
jgi:hypothetical protein